MLATPAHAVDPNVKPRQFKARQPLLGDVPLYKVIDADSGARIFWKRLGGRQSSNNKFGTNRVRREQCDKAWNAKLGNKIYTTT